jgi:hypothetical protein
MSGGVVLLGLIVAAAFGIYLWKYGVFDRARPPGWYADPAGRHRLRYWDGGTWSQWVSDTGDVALDPDGIHDTE